MPAAIEIEDLRVDYGNFTAISDLSLSIERGEIYGLIGPNGAGKTSLLNVLATLLEPTYGNVRIEGIDLDLDPRSIRGLLGHMPDQAPVIGDLKVWEFIDLFAAAHGLQGREKAMRVEACLETVGMNDRRNDFCRTLSRGMSQRVVLAKTMLHRPRVLLLDEPASGMDPMARIELKDALQNMAAEGATILLSSHILSELAEMVTGIGVIHRGSLRVHGPVERVLTSLERAAAPVEILLTDRAGDCSRWLESRGVTAAIAEKNSQQVNAEAPGDPAGQAALLRDLVEAGFSVHGFHVRRSGLEDLMRSMSLESGPAAKTEGDGKRDGKRDGEAQANAQKGPAA